MQKLRLLLVASGFCLQQLVAPVAVISSESPQVSPAQYNEKLAALKLEYKDEAVSRAFEQAQKNTDDFLQRLEPTTHGQTHSPEWALHYHNAAVEAQAGNWSAAGQELIKMFSQQDDLPDAILLKALVDQKLNDYNQALSDLEHLYKLRKERSNGYKSATEISTGRKDGYWIYMQVMNSYSEN
jgi:tetratricopeptide (TPR) repeat protein